MLGPPFTWTAIGGLAGVAVTGDVKATFRGVADDGWVMMDDGSIGPAGSGATTRANADCEDLFVLLWANVANTYAPLAGLDRLAHRPRRLGRRRLGGEPPAGPAEDAGPGHCLRRLGHGLERPGFGRSHRRRNPYADHRRDAAARPPLPGEP